MELRLYKLLQRDGKERLIEAANPAQVARHAASGIIASVAAASAREVADLLRAGVEIETAGAAE
jgi:hypothetical protein